MLCMCESLICAKTKKENAYFFKLHLKFIETKGHVESDSFQITIFQIFQNLCNHLNVSSETNLVCSNVASYAQSF